MSDKDNSNIFSISKRRSLHFLDSEERQTALGNAFDKIQQGRNEHPLSLDESANQRQYCQRQARLLNERVDRGYLSQPAEIEYAREHLAAEIREIRNDWSSTQWREFVEQGGDIPATTYANTRNEVETYIDEMRRDWKARIPEMQAEDEDFDIMQEKRSLESDVFDIENISLKYWNERGEVKKLVNEAINSPMVDKIKKMLDADTDTMRVIAMTYIRNLHNNDRLNEAIEAIDVGLEGGHLTEFEAASLRKGKLPDLSSALDGPPSDEPSF